MRTRALAVILRSLNQPSVMDEMRCNWAFRVCMWGDGKPEGRAVRDRSRDLSLTPHVHWLVRVYEMAVKTQGAWVKFD